MCLHPDYKDREDWLSLLLAVSLFMSEVGKTGFSTPVQCCISRSIQMRIIVSDLAAQARSVDTKLGSQSGSDLLDIKCV